jgi:hypothetical protein
MTSPSSERRSRSDRRSESEPTRRAPKKERSRLQRWIGIAGRDLLIIGAAIVAIVLAIQVMRPTFAGSPKVVEAISKRSPTVAKVLERPQVITPTPGDTTHRGRLVNTPQFEVDRKAFADALVQTRRVPQARADSIAYYAVREAYVNQIPPAVVFGVMLTENSRFISKALSNVGAVGLMQIYPKVWLKVLRGQFGGDLESDSTNIKYGAYILNEYLESDSGAITRGELGKGLLRYNGCVVGRNTPNCKTYPAKVAKHVEKSGSAICGDKSFYDCIGRPFMAGLLGKPESEIE